MALRAKPPPCPLRNTCTYVYIYIYIYTCATILEAAMVLELQFGSLGTVFLVFWSSRGTVKSMPKSYLNASRPAPASRLTSWLAGSVG